MEETVTQHAHEALLEALQWASKVCLTWKIYDNERSTPSLVEQRRAMEFLASALTHYHTCSQREGKRGGTCVIVHYETGE